MEAQRSSRPAPRNKRAFLVLAYRQGYRCAHCRQLLHPDSEVDHAVPWSLCGDDSDTNLQVLCPNCHAAKSAEEQPRIRRARRLLGSLQENHRGQLEGVCWGCLRFRSIFFPRCTHCQTEDGGDTAQPSSPTAQLRLTAKPCLTAKPYLTAQLRLAEEVCVPDDFTVTEGGAIVWECGSA